MEYMWFWWPLKGLKKAINRLLSMTDEWSLHTQTRNAQRLVNYT